MRGNNLILKIGKNNLNLKFLIAVLCVWVFFMSWASDRYVYAATATVPDVPDTLDKREPTSPAICERNVQPNYFEIEVVKRSRAQERDARGGVRTGSFRETSGRAVFAEVSEKEIKDIPPDKARALPGIGKDKMFVVRAVGGAKKNEPCTPMQTLVIRLREIVAIRDGKVVVNTFNDAGELLAPKGELSDVSTPQRNFSRESTFEDIGGFTREGGEKLEGTTIFQGETDGLIPHLNQKTSRGLYRFTYNVAATGRGSGGVETENRTFGVYFSIGFKSPETTGDDPDENLSGKIDKAIEELSSVSQASEARVWQTLREFGFIPETLVASSCASDINGDGQVDIADLVRVARWFGNTIVPGAKEDINQDGKVDIIDLVMVGREFGNKCSRASFALPPVAEAPAPVKSISTFASVLKSIFWVGAR